MIGKGRLQPKSRGRSGKVIQSRQPEHIRSFLGNAPFIRGDPEGSGCGAIGRLDLEPALLSASGKRQDVVAGAVTIIPGDPADLAGEVVPAETRQPILFGLIQEGFPRLTKFAGSRVALGGVEFADEPFNFGVRGVRPRAHQGRRRINQRLRRRITNDIGIGYPVLDVASVDSSLNGVKQGMLVVHRRLVALDIGQTQGGQHGADVLVLVFDRTPRPIDHVLQRPVVFRLDDSAARKFALEHIEVVRDDGFDFQRGPRFASGRLHLATLIALWLALQIIHLRLSQKVRAKNIPCSISFPTIISRLARSRYMDAIELCQILRRAYSDVREPAINDSKAHAQSELSKIHSARSSAWVERLAHALADNESGGEQTEGKSEVRPFYRGYSIETQDFGLTEFLHDICIARIGTVPANIHDARLDTVKSVLWQVESEFSSDGREAVKDFNKLVAGSGENKLFVGPYLGNSTQARSAASGYREVLRSVLIDVDIRRDENWYLGIVPHPSRWKCDDAEKVKCWRFVRDEGNWIGI